LGDECEAADRSREQAGDHRCTNCSEWSEQSEPCGNCGRDPATGDPWPEPLRHVRLDTGHVLRTWDTGKLSAGRTCLGYELRYAAGAAVFSGADFRPSPMHADDADVTLRALCGFLFLRSGDTDRDYFADYSPAQLAFSASSECEQLQWLDCADGPGELVELDADAEVQPLLM